MKRSFLGITVLSSLIVVGWVRGQAPPNQDAASPQQAALDAYFADEVWAKVGERTCLNCHRADGDAAESGFILRDLVRHADALPRNRAAFESMARALQDGKSTMLLKAVGGLEHGGGAQLKPDSSGYRILERFVRHANGAADALPPAPAGATPESFFDGVQMASPQRLLRRVTNSLAGRLPTPAERETVERGGLDAVLDAVMKEEAFYERLKEGFNDIFLTIGYRDNGDDILTFTHFKTRGWVEHYDLSHVPEEKRQRTRWDMGRDYGIACYREPLELIEYIVQNDRPFTEIVTADYFMVSPYTARGYGIFDSLRSKFKNPDDPFEFIPAQLPALTNQWSAEASQKTPTGLYPSAGLLSTFQYLRRYPTTETNRNRLRARMYYQHFLGVDVLALAPRVTDAAAISAKYKNPVMEAPDCVVCHKTVDPVAGLFQDYFVESGDYGPRKDGWFTDVFPPGREGLDLPEDQRWRALQWLGEQTAKDPRFAVAMAEHVYYILIGRRPLPPPQDIDDPLFTPRRRAYIEERREIQNAADALVRSGFNLKSVFKVLISSAFYRVDGVAAAAADPRRHAELDDVGLVRMLTPEQLERKVAAVFGERWDRLSVTGDQRLGILYGGIDSQEVTQRLTDPSGAIGALQRLMANEVANKHVPADFRLPPAERRLFPEIEPGVVPWDGPEAQAKIRKAIVHLHEHVLGRHDAPDHPEVERTYQLFTSIVEDARGRKDWEKTFYWYGADKQVDDPHFTVRAWRGVVTYLLRQHEFLYE